MTRHELGVVKILPMKGHLTLDAAAGATQAALPYLLEEENEAVTACAVGLGLADMAIAALTDKKSLPAQVRGITASTTTRLPAEPGRPETVPREDWLPVASTAKALKFNLGTIVPTVSMGPIVRRPSVMKLVER